MLLQNVGDCSPLYSASHPRSRASLLTNEVMNQKLRVIISRRSTYQNEGVRILQHLKLHNRPDSLFTHNVVYLSR